MAKKSSRAVSAEPVKNPVSVKSSRPRIKKEKPPSQVVDSLTTKSDAQLHSLLLEIHQELLKRGAKQASSRLAALMSWTQAVLTLTHRTTLAAHWLSQISKKRAADVKKACGVADDFVHSLGTWTVQEFTDLQRCTIVAVIEHLKVCEEDSDDPEMIMLSLSRASKAFACQFPGYIEQGMLGFLLRRAE